MNEAVLLLVLLNFGFIGALPRVFFRQGNLNPMWWLTTAPFFLCIVVLVASYFEAVPAMTEGLLYRSPYLELAAVAVAGGSIALIAFTLGTHRTRISLWHQRDNQPERLVTYGAYGLVRHPFYASFLLALLGAVLLWPHTGTILALVYGIAALNFTAAREERQLLSSPMGAEYRAYMRRAGRFLPKVRST